MTDVKDEIDFIVPVYNEGSNIASALAELYAEVTRPKRVLIVYDFDEDDTVPVVRELALAAPVSSWCATRTAGA